MHTTRDIIDALRKAGGDGWDKIDDPEEFLGRKNIEVSTAFMAAVRELIFHYHAFGLMASPDFHKLFRELAAMLPPETAP